MFDCHGAAHAVYEQERADDEAGESGVADHVEQVAVEHLDALGCFLDVGLLCLLIQQELDLVALHADIYTRIARIVVTAKGVSRAFTINQVGEPANIPGGDSGGDPGSILGNASTDFLWASKLALNASALSNSS